MNFAWSYNSSDEHDAKHGVRSGPEQPLAQEHRDKPGA
jgi:hypothetical protein